MRIWLVACGLIGAICGVARAGLYMPGEEPPIVVQNGKPQPLPIDAFRVVMQDYMLIAIPQIPIPGTNPIQFKESDRHKEFLKQRDSLLAKGEQATTEEIVRLGAILIRLRDFERALGVLHKARSRDPRNFVVQSHFALTLYQLGQRDAANNQLDALSLKPSEFLGYGREQSAWYVRVERVFFELLKSRLKEQRERGPRAPVETLDPIFHSNFVGDSGNYEAGAMAAAEKAKLPEDALAVVQQLLLWMPDDPRLYWLLAEIYNAQGEIKIAATIFDECVDARRFQTEQLRAHRNIVKDAVAQQKALAEQRPASWRDHPEVLWIAVGLLLLIVLPFVYWQVREVRKRLGGCNTGH